MREQVNLNGPKRFEKPVETSTVVWWLIGVTLSLRQPNDKKDINSRAILKKLHRYVNDRMECNFR